MTKQEILQQLLNNIHNEYDKTTGSFFYDFCSSVAIELEKAYITMESILNQGFTKTATASYLDTKVAEQGLVRKESTKATGLAKIMIDINSLNDFPTGEKVSSDTLIFTITAEGEVSIDETYIIVPVECDTPGIIGNVPISAINSFPVTLPGIISVSNETALSGGFETEDDIQLRDRYFQKVGYPISSGNALSYEFWAREVSGVGDAKVIPLWNGAGTVKVIIVNTARGVANASLITDVTTYIETVRPVGAVVTVVSAVPKVIAISVHLIKKEGITDLVAISQMTDSISSYFMSIPFSQNYASYAQIGKAILSCDGIVDFSGLTINSGVVNISILATEVAVLGAITIV